MSRSFARRTGLVAVGQASVKATQLVVAVLLVRMLSPAEWNQTAFLLSIYLAGTTIGTLNLHHGIVFFLPRVGRHGGRALVAQNIGVMLGIGSAAVVGLTLAAPALSGGRLGDAALLPWLGLAIALELPAPSAAMTLIATGHFGGAALWDVAGTLLVIVGTTAPVAAGLGITGVATGLVAVGAMRFLGAIWVVARTLPGRLGALPLSFVGEQVRFGLPLGIALAVSMSNRLVDKWLIAWFHPGDFGVYAVAAQEVPLLAVLPYAGGAALVTSLVESFRAGDTAGARTQWIGLTGRMSFVVVPVGVGLILVAPEVITLVFTDDFVDGVLPFRLFTLVTLHRVAEYAMLLRAAGRTRDLLAVAAVTFGANLLLAGVGAYLAGMVGASLGTLAASAIGWWYAMRKISALLAVPVREAFAWRTWLTCVVVTAAAAAGAAVVSLAVPDVPVTRLIAKLAAFAAFSIVVLSVWRRRAEPPLGRLVAPDDRDLVRAGGMP